MLKMNIIEHILELKNSGKTYSQISELLKIDVKTVKKYCNIDDFSANSPIKIKERASKIDKWSNKINEWLEEDKKMRYKQRHTAKRIHERLKEEYKDTYTCSYSAIQRYIKRKKEIKTKQVGNQELVWHPGEAQADFGEADFIENGIKVTKKYFCLTFPYSNAGFMQVFGGETSECVIQGLLNVFNHIKAIPTRIVFDNASGVGRRVKNNISLSELFKRFKCHYGFSVTFCNPNSGHEKGNVENKVGYFRKNFFVPIPKYSDLIEYNKKLLEACDKDNKRNHYKKGKEINNLFDNDKSKMLYLPSKAFNPVRYEQIKTDNYGKICLQGNHFYSTSPDYAQKVVVVEIGAYFITIMSCDGKIITNYKREYGAKRTDSTNWETTIKRLIRNPGSWRNSGIREQLPELLKEKLDGYEKSGLKDVLKAMKDLSRRFDFDIVIEAMNEAAKSTRIDLNNTLAILNRIQSNGLNGVVNSCPDLKSYDAMLNKGEN